MVLVYVCLLNAPQENVLQNTVDRLVAILKGVILFATVIQGNAIQYGHVPPIFAFPAKWVEGQLYFS